MERERTAMKNKGMIFLILLIAALFVIQTRAFANGIDLDGQFNDWEDKPSLESSGQYSGEAAIRLVKWFPDLSTGMVYFYAERFSATEEGVPFTDWDFDLYLKGDLGVKKLHIHYHPPSKFVDVDLTDEIGRWLWGEKGKWGEWRDSGKAIEFRVPFEYIVGNTHAGYQIEAYFETGDNRLPESGMILISTISTYPYVTTGLMFGLAAFGFYAVRKKRTSCAEALKRAE